MSFFTISVDKVTGSLPSDDRTPTYIQSECVDSLWACCFLRSITLQLNYVFLLLVILKTPL